MAAYFKDDYGHIYNIKEREGAMVRQCIRCGSITELKCSDCAFLVTGQCRLDSKKPVNKAKDTKACKKIYFTDMSRDWYSQKCV